MKIEKTVDKLEEIYIDMVNNKTIPMQMRTKLIDLIGEIRQLLPSEFNEEKEKLAYLIRDL